MWSYVREHENGERDVLVHGTMEDCLSTLLEDRWGHWSILEDRGIVGLSLEWSPDGAQLG